MTASITARQGFVGRLFESMKNNDKGRCVVLFLNKKKLFQLDRRLQTCASMAVSYTHLDVYKRQENMFRSFGNI